MLLLMLLFLWTISYNWNIDQWVETYDFSKNHMSIFKFLSTIKLPRIDQSLCRFINFQESQTKTINHLNETIL